MQSPFLFGRPVSDRTFIDRNEEIDRLKFNFQNKINTTIISPRYWGKSSLVEKVANEINSKKNKVVIVDLLSVRNEEEFYSVLSTAVIKAGSGKVEKRLKYSKKFLQRVNPKIAFGENEVNDFEIIFDSDTIKNNYSEILQLPQKIARDKNINFIICIDHFQNTGEFSHHEQFQKRLRSEWQHQQNVTYCLYGSKQHRMMHLFEKPSMPFYKFGEIINLDKIDEKSWTRFITDSFKKTKKSIDASLALQIAQSVKCHPYYVQQLSHLTWTNTTKKTTASVIEQSLNNMLDQNAILYIKETENLSDSQLNFLKAIASEAKILSSKETIHKFKLGTSANVIKVKTTLLNREIIHVNSKKVEFIDPVFELWIRKNILKKSLQIFHFKQKEN